MGLLDGDIKASVFQAAQSVFLDFVVRNPNQGTYDKDAQAFTGSSTPTSYTCKGIVEDYTNREREESNITEKDRKILILAGSISVMPKQGWEVEDNDGNKYEIVGPIKTDPAGATYQIQGRL